MCELLGQLSQLCRRVCIPEHLEACRSLPGERLVEEVERVSAFSSFRTSLFCIGFLYENRHKLQPERRQILDRIFSDADLEMKLARLLAEMRPLEFPEDLLYCVNQHGQIALALAQRLEELFEGLE